MEDAERSVVTRIHLIGIQRTASIQCVTEGVDVERTADGTRNDVGALIQRTRSLLIAVATVGTQGDGKVLRQVI